MHVEEPDMRIYLVGGAVRDWLLGRVPREFDYAFDADGEAFLRRYPDAQRVGKLGVFLQQGREYLPLYGGSVQSDLVRRDLTINALALESNGVIHAHPQAFADLRDGVLRPASPTSFMDDPARVFRLARFACYFPDFSVHPEALTQMRAVAGAGLLADLPRERVGRECLKALAGVQPSRWLDILHQGACLAPWLGEWLGADVIPAGPAPWHNESVLAHSMALMDAVAGEPLRVWMALAHDLGKTRTDPAHWPRHHGHDTLGEAEAAALGQRLALPVKFIKAGMLAARLHMTAGRYPELRRGTRRDLLLTVHAAGFDIPFWKLVEADSGQVLFPLVQRDLAILLAVQLPREHQNRGPLSGEILRALQCQALPRRGM